MSKRLRQQQHRPAREEQRAREVADLKRENHRLKRQVTRLRKDNVKVNDLMFDRTSTEAVPVRMGCTLTSEVIEEAHQRAVEEMGGPQCPNGCGILRTLDLGVGNFWVCPVCKYRHKAS